MRLFFSALGRSFTLLMLPLFDGNEGDVVFALLGKLHIEDNGTSISVSTLLLLRQKKKMHEFPWQSSG